MVASKVVDLAKWQLAFSSYSLKMEGENLAKWRFFSQKNCQINNVIKSKFITNCKYAKKGHLNHKKNDFHVNFAVINLKKKLHISKKVLFKTI